MRFPFKDLPFFRKEWPSSEAIECLRGIQASVEAIAGSIHQLEIPWPDQTGPSEDPRIAVLENKLTDLTMALSDGIQRVQRSENRVRAIVQGAKRDLAEAGFEHAGVEAEAAELRRVDGSDSEAEQVPTVPQDVADDQRGPSSIPGVSVGELRRSFAR